MNINLARLLALAAATSCLGLGCSFSYSSKSISDSIAGSSESISDSSASSSPSETSDTSSQALYREDVRDYTAAFVRDGGDVASFQRGLGRIARQHGVSDWEAVDATWGGIGEGLRRAQATRQQIDGLSSDLAGDDAAKRREIERGYDGHA